MSAAIFAIVFASIGPASASDAVAGLAVPNVVAQTAGVASSSIAGTVSTAGGEPVAGARVTATGPATATVTTAEDGTFAFTLPPGSYTLNVGKGGYQPVSLGGIVLVSGTAQPVKVTLSQVDLSSFRTIGTVTATVSGRSSINTGASATTFVPGAAFSENAIPQVNDVLQRVPDVTIEKMGSQQDTSIVVAGLQPYETQVLIDGHPISLGQYGVWLSEYYPSFLVGGAEVQTGAGNTTPFANLAVGGTVNLTTPGYTTKPTVEGSYGYDSYQAQNYNVLATGSVGSSSQLQYVLGEGYSSTNGPYNKASECDVSVDYAGAPANNPGAVGIIPFCGNFNGGFWNKGLLSKLKYNFSPSTSFELSFIGTYGGYSPQGSSWGTADGPVTIEPCLIGLPQQCGDQTYASLNGQTINGFTWYPGTVITNVQQLYTAQFRTSFGNDSILLRPYIASLQPNFYDATGEQAYPSFLGAYTTSPNYQPPSLAPGQQIPLGPNSGPNGGLPNPNNFEAVTNCGPFNPPYNGNYAAVFYLLNSQQNTIGTTAQGQEICYQYPYSTYEQDKLWGGTLSYVHPFGDSDVTFNYDYHGGSTFAFFNDSQNVSVPLSTTRFSTFSVTGDLRLIPKLGVNIGLYQTQWLLSGEQVTGVNIVNMVPVPVIGSLERSVSRFDPHVALVYRSNTNTSFRLAYGSSETFPFVGDVSGTPACQPFASSSPTYTAGICTQKTPNLEPEFASSYNLGADERLKNGAILSMDLSDTTVHNVFEQIASEQPVGALILGVFTPINAALLKTQLATLKYSYAPRVGFGFNASVAADRSIISGIPLSSYNPNYGTLPANNVQICGTGQFTPGIPTCIPYLKGYGQFTYAMRDQTHVALGVDYEGKNNAYYQPPFAILDFAYSHPINHDLELLVSVSNLLNTNSFEYLPAPNAGEPAIADIVTPSGSLGQTSYPTALIPATTRTLRGELRVHFGR
jgi:hypothetical protein